MTHHNVPDDWWYYERTCKICGTRWHLSEGACCWCELLTDEEREEIHDNLGRLEYERQEYENRDD